MVKTPAQATKHQKPQGHRHQGVRSAAAAARGVGEKGAAKTLTVFYSPNALASRQNLASIPADWQMVPPESKTSGAGHSKGFYLTTMDDLIADLVEQNLLTRTGPDKAYKGILIHSSKATSRKKDRLFSLLSCSAGRGRNTPWLASNSIRVIRRVLEAQRHGHGDAVIATAFVEGRVLIVQDANLAMHVIAADDHPNLKDLSTEQLASFTIDSAGSGLHWRALDLDLDLDGIRAHPTEALAAYRRQRGAALQQWLQHHPEARTQLSKELMQAIDQVVEGKADLRSELAGELAEACRLQPSDLLDQLAELQQQRHDGSP